MQSWRVISKWFRNPLWNYPNFEFTHCHFDVSPPLPQELHLGYSIYPKWTSHHFEAREVRSLTLQTMYKSELKGRSHDHLKTTMQSWRVILKWFRNSTYEFEIHFEITSISNSPTATLMFHLLYLGNCI